MWSLRANEIHGHGVADTPGNKLSSESDTDYKFLVRNAESVKNLKKPSIDCRIRKKILLEHNYLSELTPHRVKRNTHHADNTRCWPLSQSHTFRQNDSRSIAILVSKKLTEKYRFHSSSKVMEHAILLSKRSSSCKMEPVCLLQPVLTKMHA